MSIEVQQRTADGFTAVITNAKDPKERTCLRCGCTDSRACPGGCSWIDGEIDVCSTCIDVHDVVADEVWSERHRQDALRLAGKIPFTCADRTVPAKDKLAVVVEEVGEIAEALQRPGQLTSRTRAHLRMEIIQAAAVLHAWAESLTPRPGEKGRP